MSYYTPNDLYRLQEELQRVRSLWREQAEREKAARDRWYARHAENTAKATAARARYKELLSDPVIDARSRRTRIDWSEMLPPAVAKAQVEYERSATAVAMYRAGLGATAIAKRLCVSRTRAKQLAMRERAVREQSPADKYLSDPPEAEVRAINKFTATRRGYRRPLVVMPPLPDFVPNPAFCPGAGFHHSGAGVG